MTLSHNKNRLYSNPAYSNGGFTPFRFQEGSNGMGSVDDVLGGASPDQVSAAQVENLYSTNPYLNSNSLQNLLSGSSGPWIIGGGLLVVILLISGGRRG